MIASPVNVRKPEEIKSNEILDFTQYLMDGRIVLKKKKYPPFFTKLPSYQIHLKKLERLRHFDETRINLLAEYGQLHSFLTDKYPEAQLLSKRKSQKDDEE